MDLTVVIPYRDGQRHIDRTLASIHVPEVWAHVPVLVVDDCSAVPFRNPKVRSVRLSERGYFSGGCNRGFQETKGDVVILNQDAELQGDAWLKRWAEVREKYAVWGDGVMNHPAWPKGYVQGTFMAIRRDALDAVGPFNERDYPLWGATCEWQLRACRMGFRALPEKVPGLKHYREGAHGESIREALREEPERKGLLIRTPPAVSIVVATYNQGRFLADCMGSVLGGKTSLGEFPRPSWNDFEIVIVDDSSKDWQIAQGYADAWKGIRFVKRDRNEGSPAAYNSAIRRSFGKAITILAADDMREPGSIEAMWRAMQPGAFVYDDVCEFARGERTLVREFPEWGFGRLAFRNYIHSAIMFWRSAWERVGGYPDLMRQGREDWAYNVALGRAGYRGIHIAQPGLLYRRERQNRSLTNGGCDWLLHFLEQLEKLYPDVYGGRVEEIWMARGCCGGRRVPRGNGKNKEETLVGAKGMVLLEYVGGNAGNMTFFGTVTNQRYTFGGSRKRGYVDSRDAEAFLKMRKGTKRVFKAGQILKRPGIPPNTPRLDLTQPPAPPTPAEAEEPAASRSVRQWKETDLSVFSEEDIKEIILTETAGENRKTVLALLGKELRERVTA